LPRNSNNRYTRSNISEIAIPSITPSPLSASIDDRTTKKKKKKKLHFHPLAWGVISN
jgi:hypothetical protein